MKKVLIIMIISIFLISLASAEIIFTQQPKELYNFGDVVNLPLKITTLSDIQKFFTLNLICNGIDTEIHKEYITLKAGDEKSITPSVPITKLFITTSGSCKLKSTLGSEFVLTNEFKISDIINVKVTSEQKEFSPGENIAINGEAVKENEEMVNGFIEAKVLSGDGSAEIDYTDTVNNGYISLNMSLP